MLFSKIESDLLGIRERIGREMLGNREAEIASRRELLTQNAGMNER